MLPTLTDPALGKVGPLAGRPNCKRVVYKPNNPQYAKEGAVSSSTRILKLTVDTISTNAASMNKTVNTLHDTVLTIDHSMGLFGKFLKYGIFPITVFLLGETFWVFLTRSQ